jgi:acetyl-CoA acyltransferase
VPEVREAVIVEAVRSPIGKRNGSLKDTHPVDLLADVLRELIVRSGVDAEQVEDNITGCVSQAGEQTFNIGRNAWLAAGLPEEVPATTIDRQCGSSQQSIHFAAQGVMAGAYDLVVASGVENMTRVPMFSSTMGQNPFGTQLLARYEGKLVPQGISADLIATRWDITREESDDFAFRSRMATLPPAFQSPEYEAMFPGELHWTVTAGNSSQISDGAGAVLIASREKADQLGLTPRARFLSFALAGDSPILMLTAPIPATRAALGRAGLTLEDMDVVEINEAFASVVLAWQRELGVADAWLDEHVNPSGGAIAVGHPLGATGAKLMTTMLHELERTGGRYGLQTMCEGGGMANALVVERLG